ncbi:MAG: methyltransferase [Desulfovibrionaceae bacterium]
MADMTTAQLEAATLDDLLAHAQGKFQVAFEPVSVAGVTLHMLQITNMTEYVDRLAETTRDEALQLPFWAMIWPSAILTSYFLRRMPLEGQRVLELGAGVGVAGLFAAAWGAQVTLSDIDPDALLFTRINALTNNLGDRVRVRRIDFINDRLDERFDLILGCEIMYKEAFGRGLVKFLLHHLAATPEAEAVLSHNYTRKGKKFLSLADEVFHIQEKNIGFKEKTDAASPECQIVTIHRLRPRQQIS